MADFDPQAWADEQVANFDPEKWAESQLNPEAQVKPVYSTGKYEPQLGQAPKGHLPPTSLADMLKTAVIQGGTLGAADELKEGETPGGVSSLYRIAKGLPDAPPAPHPSVREADLQAMHNAEASYPVAYPIVEAISSIPAFMAVGGPIKAGQGIWKGLRSAARAGGIGGATVGYASSEDPNRTVDTVTSSIAGSLLGPLAYGVTAGAGALGTRLSKAGTMDAALETLAQHEGIPNPRVAQVQELVGKGNPVPLQAVENPANRITLQKMFKQPEISRTSGKGEALVRGAVSEADAANTSAAKGLSNAEAALETEKTAYRNTARAARNARNVAEHEAKAKYQDAEHARSVRGVERKNQYLSDKEEQVQAIKAARETRNQELTNLRDTHPGLDQALRVSNTKELPRVLDKHLGPEGEPVRADLDTAWENLTRAREPIPKPRTELPVAPTKTAPYQEPSSEALDAARQAKTTAKQKVGDVAASTQHVYDAAASLEKSMAKIHGAKNSLSDLLSPTKNLKRLIGKQAFDNRAAKKILSNEETYNQFMDLAAKGERLSPGTPEADRWAASLTAFMQTYLDK